MSIDTAALLAQRYKSDPSPLKAAVLGQGTGDINPYAALRALQMQKEAERYMIAQAAMNGQKYQNQPSMVQQALNPAPPQMPQQGMPQQPQGMPQQPQGMPQEQAPQQPQGLEQMQQMQQQPEQPSPGLEGMPAGDQQFAGGGIIAFAGADGSQVEDDEDELGSQLEGLLPSKGEPASYQQFSRAIPAYIQNVAQQKYVPMTTQAYDAALQSHYDTLKGFAGTEDPYGQFKTQLGAQDTARAQGLEQNKGLAMMAAAGDILEPGGLIRGAGKAAKTFASQYGAAMAADKTEQRAIQSMQFNLADAERKERMGLGREAIAAAEAARKSHGEAQKAKLDKSKALATLAISGARATKPTGTGGAAKSLKGYDNLLDSIYQDMLADPANKGISPAKLRRQAATEAADLWGKLSGQRAGDLRELPSDTTRGTAINERLEKWESLDPSIQTLKKNDPEKYAQRKAEKRAELEKSYDSKAKDGNKNSSSKGGSAVNYSDLWGDSSKK